MGATAKTDKEIAMTAAKLAEREKIALKPLKPSRPAFFDTSKLPWVPWVMDGTHFKLLNIDQKTGGFTLMLKVDPGNEAPVHGHIGAVEAYVLSGGFAYDEDGGGEGFYVYEAAGARHMPDSPQGSIMFAVVHGPLVGYNEDGTVAAIVDAKMMYEMAAAHGVAGHLEHLAYFPK
jgi:anti-sigma factor ChrR (cupin superfamily)